MPVLQDLIYSGPPLTPSHFRDYHPTIRPDWRWQRVMEMVAHTPRPLRNKRFDDMYVRTMRQFMLRYRGETDDQRQALFADYPGCHHALELHRDPDGADSRLFIQSRMLARQTHDEIAAVTGMMPIAIEWYEKIFFNISERIDNRDWIVRHVLGPESLRQLDNQELVIKLLSYFGGIAVLNFMITGCRDVEHPQTPEEVVGYVSDYATDGIFRKAAMAVYCYTPNKYKIEGLLDMARQLRADTKAKEDETDRLEVVAGAVRHTLESIRFIKGDMAEEWLKKHSPKLLEYDNFQAELRDQQVYSVISGNLDAVEHMRHRKFPDPPKRGSHQQLVKDQSNEDPLEGS